MTSGKSDSELPGCAPGAAERAVFDATITPHRSLGQNGFRIVMTLVCLASVISSLPFVILGAWPVAGFFGIDVLALFVAFHINFRHARAFERIVVSPLEVLLRKVSRCNDDHFYNRFMSRPGTPPLLRRTKCPTVCSATNIRLLG